MHEHQQHVSPAGSETHMGAALFWSVSVLAGALFVLVAPFPDVALLDVVVILVAVGVLRRGIAREENHE